MRDEPLSGSTLRIGFFGTPEIAVPTLESLIEGPHEVAVVVTQPDRRRGRGRRSSPSPVARAAEAAKVPVLRVEQVGAPACVEALRAHALDLGVVVAFGQFLPRAVRELPSLGCLINAHASLLPRHRGAAPIAHAILCGDAVTGISVMRVEREMDSGPVTLTRETPIGPSETAGELAARLGRLAAEAISAAVDRIADGTARWEEQDSRGATFAPKIGREDARLDWTESAAMLVRRVRAMAPSPGAFTMQGDEPLRILAAHDDPEVASDAPGTVRRGADGALRIATGRGWLVPDVVQRAGGRPLAIEAYLRGRKVDEGTVLGDRGAAAELEPAPRRRA